MASTTEYFKRQVKGPSLDAGEEMQYEFARLATFENWPHWARLRPTKLAAAGFFYLGSGDTVTCFSCQCDIGQWQAGQDPKDEHRKRYPNCRLTRGENASNVPLVKVDDPVLSADMTEHSEHSNARTIATTNGLNQIYTIIPNVRHLEEEMSSDSMFSSMTLTEKLASIGFCINSSRPVTNGDHHTRRSNHSSREADSRIFTSSPAEGIPTLGSLSGIDPQQTKLESYRLSTFDLEWPETAFVGPPELAKNGFYYLGNLDRVRCAFCNGVLRNWSPDDRPEEEHKRHFSHCPFVRGLDVGNISLEQEAQGIQIVAANRARQPNPASLGVLTERPRHPEYAIEASRVATYRNWPKMNIQSPETLARAGFFFVGYSDNCKCFFCDGGLRNWEAPDDPWVEHARWFPHCGFLRMCKGDEYIHQIQTEYDMIEEPAQPPAHGSGPHLPGVDYRVDPRDVRARMDTVTVRAVRPMGFPDDVIMAVIEQQLRSNGEDFSSADELVQAIFDYHQQDQSQQGAALQHTTSQPQSSLGDQESETSLSTAEPARKNNRKRNRKKRNKKTSGNVDGNSNKEEVTSVPSGDEKTAIPANSTEKASAEDAEAYEEDDPTTLYEENQRMKDQRICKICMDADVNIVFLPCGHLVCCGSCAPALRKCPVCRNDIKGTVRTFMS